MFEHSLWPQKIELRADSHSNCVFWPEGTTTTETTKQNQYLGQLAGYKHVVNTWFVASIRTQLRADSHSNNVFQPEGTITTEKAKNTLVSGPKGGL